MDDLLRLDEQLSSEERLIRESVQKFVDTHVLPDIATHYENATFPETLIEKMKGLGLFGMTLPEKYGGSEVNYVSYGLTCQELEKGDSSIRSFVSVQSSLCMYPIFAYGSEDQKQHWLPKMAAAEVIGCFGLTEADSGSDPGSLSTSAKKVEGGWLLNGAKLWITNATLAHLAIVWAQTPEGIRGFLVEKDFEGFTTSEIKQKMSLRASNTGELVFTDCFVPESHLLPGTDVGLAAALSCLTEARYGIAWGAMGAAMTCYECALAYAQNRKQFNRPISQFQLVQKELVDMYAEIVKAQCLNLHIGRLKDKQQYHYAISSLGKMTACQQALSIARKARNLLGANGISLEYPVIRHLHNLETVFTYEGTDNIHHLILGKYLTGENAFG